MPTSYTTNLGLALPVQGELAGTWGNVVNTEITELLDNAIAGTTTLSSDADVTLTDTDGAANQSRQAILLWTAAGTVTRTITAPARTKAYIVINATGSTQSIKLVGAGPTTGITVVAGEKCVAAWNGSDFVKVASTAISNLTGATTVGTNYLTLTNPSAITFPRMNADNTVSALSAADFRTAIGAGTGGGSVTSVDVSGGTTGLTTSGGPITGSGTITLAGTLGVANGGTGATTLTGILKGNGTSAFTAATAGTDYVTPTGSETLTNKTIEAGTFTNGYTEEVATANTGTAYTINLANGSVQILTLTGNCTFTFPTATAGKSFMLFLKQDATGSRTVTWPSSTNPVKWPGGTAPTITATANKMDKFVFTADGTNWIGSNAGQNYL